MTELRFEGRVAVVTGAARGLGRAYAALLAVRGASVIVNDIDADAADEAAGTMAGARAFHADVVSPAGASALVQDALDAHGRIDIVVANAGTSWHRPFADLTADDVHAVFGPSVLGTFNVVHAAHGVFANSVLPWAATRLSRPGGGAPDAALAAPPVVWLCHDACRENGEAFVVGGGRVARVTFAPGPSHDVIDRTPEAYGDAISRPR